MKIVSWNVNGLRSTEKEFLELVSSNSYDIILLQEVRAEIDQLSIFLRYIPGYNVFFNPAKKPGYSGTAIYYREDIDHIELQKPSLKLLSQEGRCCQLDYKNYAILNLYIPNGNSSNKRLKFKLYYLNELIDYIKKLQDNGKEAILAGDFNIAHKPIDLHDPVANKNKSGFLEIERDIFEQILDLNLIDIYRKSYPQKTAYTWWSFFDRDRTENKGWRLDYYLISDAIKDCVSEIKILKNQFGSDHCPILLDIDI